MHKVFSYPNPFHLENGDSLPSIELAYTTHGQLNAARDNVIWVCHALTANANPLEWWPGFFSEEKGIDPSTYFIVCVNMLGSCYGSTNPNSKSLIKHKKHGLNFPCISIRDIVKSLEVLRKELNIQQIQYAIGGSMGGMQAMEWAISHPEKIKNLVLLATTARHSAWGIALNESQRMAIEADFSFYENTTDAGKKGLEAARAMALISYRNYATYATTQTDDTEKTDKFKASSYQKYQGEKLAKRFDAKSYWYLSKAMDSHNVGRKRGGCQAALAKIKAKTLVIGIESDVLFPIEEQAFLAKHIPDAKLEVIDSMYGHDGFLIEIEKINLLTKKHFTI